jgi:hypothetical protein
MPPTRPAFAAALRGARRWGLWLAFVLAAAHSLAAWHAYTHPASPAAERSSKSHAAGDVCAVCVAAAAIGGAPSSPPAWHLAALAPAAPARLATPAVPQAAAPRPYAIRAPPARA